MPSIRILNRQTLSHKKYLLEQVSFEKNDKDEKTLKSQREIYHRPSAAAVLLIDPERKTVIFTKQFRLPVYLNGETDPLLEVPAGIIDEGESPEDCIIRETHEETGYVLRLPKKVGEVYTSPGGITEMIHLFIGEVNVEQKEGEGGGLKQEGEEIVLSTRI